MATYIPNATQTTEPVESRTVESAALEFRTLKTSINARIEDVQTQNNAQDVRLQAIEAALLVIGEGGLPGTVYVQRFSGTGAQTSFTLNVSVPSSALIDVFINGIYQNKNTFTVVDDVLTFSEAPPAGTDNVEVVVSITVANVETDASLVSFRATDSTVVVRTAQDKMREYVSVKDFGATGDGVTDDTAAIAAAIAAMPAAGGEIYFPCGKYLFSSTLIINKPILLRGTGSGATNNSNVGSVLLKASTLNGDGIQLSALGAKIQDMTVQGITGNGGDGIVLIESRCVLHDVSVFNMGQDGVRIGIDAGGNSNLWVIRNLKSKNNVRDGLRISSNVRPTLPDANGGVLTMADLQNNGDCGLYLGNNLVNTFIGVVSQANGTYGVYSSSASQGNFFFGGDYEVNGRGGTSSTSFYDFFIESGSSGNTLFGGSAYNFPQSFLCNEPQNMIVGFRDGIYSGDDQYAGLQLFNIDSTKPTVLDWYEEGTFTPVLVGTTSAGVGTYSVQTGQFTRIGNTVRFNLSISWSAHTGTGNMQLQGLPFLSANVGFQPVNIVVSNMTTPVGAVVNAMVVGNSQVINLYSILTGGTSTFAALAMDTSASCWVSGTYHVA